MRPVMLATDGSPTAEKATSTAIDLSRMLDTEMVIMSVWDLPYPAYSAMGFAPVPTSADLAQLGEDEAARIVSEAAARAEEVGVETRTITVRGFPAKAICDAAERIAPEFLVIGSHGWGVLKRAIFGSVSTGVLHHASCPVLVVPAHDPRESGAGRRELALTSRLGGRNNDEGP